MLSRKSDAVWFTVGVLVILGFLYLGVERLLLSKFNVQLQFVQYKNALLTCQRDFRQLKGK